MMARQHQPKASPWDWDTMEYSLVLSCSQPWAETSKTTMQSFMGRVNYSYQKRYMLSASVRYDGASQLAEGHKYDGFTAFSVGWNLMEEAFMERFRHVVPEFKLRASYGTAGQCGCSVVCLPVEVYSRLGCQQQSYPCHFPVE